MMTRAAMTMGLVTMVTTTGPASTISIWMELVGTTELMGTTEPVGTMELMGTMEPVGMTEPVGTTEPVTEPVTARMSDIWGRKRKRMKGQFHRQ
jgi:hypothetical protein